MQTFFVSRSINFHASGRFYIIWTDVSKKCFLAAFLFECCRRWMELHVVWYFSNSSLKVVIELNITREYRMVFGWVKLKMMWISKKGRTRLRFGGFVCHVPHSLAYQTGKIEWTGEKEAFPLDLCICIDLHTHSFIKCSIWFSCAINSTKWEKNAKINKASNENIIQKKTEQTLNWNENRPTHHHQTTFGLDMHTDCNSSAM